MGEFIVLTGLVRDMKALINCLDSFLISAREPGFL